MRRAVAAGVLVVAGLATTARGQGSERVPVARRAAPDPTSAQLERREELSRVTDAASEAIRRERARRMAPIDLTGGHAVSGRAFAALAPWLPVLASGACGESQPEARDPQGAVRFPLASEAKRMTEDGKVARELEDGDVTVTPQRIAKDDRVLRGRELDGVAEAVVTRFELASFDAEMSRSACTVAGGGGYCLDGTMDAGDGELVRRGVLVPAGEEFLLIEAIGPRAQQAAVYAQARLVQDGLERLDEGE